MDQVLKFLEKFYLGMGTPLALSCYLQVRYGEWAALQKRKLRSPSSYLDANAYFDDAKVIELTRKLLLPGDNEARADAAKATFFLAEEQCHRTNLRLGRFLDDGLLSPEDIPVADFIHRWRKRIKRVLGRASFNLNPRFSGGSTLSDAGKLITIPDKMSSTLTTYHGLDLLPFRFTIMAAAAAVCVTGNRFFTVPKNSQTDRGCCVEASAAISLQLAAARLIRKRYRNWYKVDLKHAQPIHRRRACVASVDGRHATVDLSNASDTVARLLVRLLLPRDWWLLLNSLRATHSVVDGKAYYLAKFSSMGNGFTFELETLLFRTLCDALGSEEASVYGDDIIIETGLAGDLIAALRFFGFTPNVDKTFCEGPFRESCGGDFFDGQPVRAHYLESIPDEPQKWISLHNGLHALNDHRLRAAMRYCVDQVPMEWRNFGPVKLGDLLFHSDEALPRMREWTTEEWEYDPAKDLPPKRVRVKHGRAPFWRVMRPVTRKYDLGSYWKPDVALAAGAYGAPSKISTRDDITGYRSDFILDWGLSDDPSWWTEHVNMSVVSED